MTPCKSTREAILDWVISDQSDSLSRECQTHLDGCADCRGYRDALLRQARDLDDLGRAMNMGVDGACEKTKSACHALVRSLPHREVAPVGGARRRFLPLAVAAVLLFLVGITLVHLRMDLTSVTFARMKRAVNQVAWLHIVMRGDHPRYMDLHEVWAGFETGVLAAKHTEGLMEFVDLPGEKEYRYRPQDGYIQVEQVRLARFVYDLSSPLAFLQSVLRNFEAEGAQLAHGAGHYRGRPVKVITATTVYPHGTCTLKLSIDPETHLLCAGKETWAGPGVLARSTEIEIDYPPNGPSSIYDLGVPAMAEIHGGKPFEFLTPQ